MTSRPEINIDEDTNDRDWIRLLPPRVPLPTTLDEALAVLTKDETESTK